MRARLVSLDGGPSIDLARDVIVVGRNADCDVKIDDKSVSKLHCVLIRGEGAVLVRDLGSTNGTRVNGRRVRRAVLLPEDDIALAAFRYRLRVGDRVDEPVNPQDSGGVIDRSLFATDKTDEARFDEDPPSSLPHRVNTHPDDYPDDGPPRPREEGPKTGW